MTKKSKKKALKTGCKNPSSSRQTSSIYLGLTVQSTDLSEDFNEQPPSFTSRRRPRKRNSAERNIELVDEDINAKSYPFDIWYHISKFIRPEQVKIFSLICRFTWLITCTSDFWLTLYHKYSLASIEKLPVRLQPEYIDSRPGIKSRVIRALFHVYPPLTERNPTPSPDVILNGRCILFWWEKAYSIKRGTSIWTFYMKVSHLHGTNNLPHNNACKNSEASNCVVRVRCPNYVYLKSTIGMVLTCINLSMSTDMRYHQLKMTFHNERKDKKYNKNDGLVVLINPIIEMNILNWWHPSYPNLNEK